MSRPLDPNELVCFGFSIFDCEARRECRQIGRVVEDRVVVTVTIARGMLWRFVCGSNLTIDEIQELTAYRMLDFLRKTEAEVVTYAKKFAEKVQV